MSDEFYTAYFAFCAGFVVSMLFAVALMPHAGFLREDKKKVIPINCVIDYHRDGIHYCILENK